MGDTLNDWKILKLGNILDVKHGKNQKEVEVLGGKYPILGTGGEIGRTNDYLYNKPSVLIGRKGTIDKPKYIDTPFWTVDTLFYTNIKAGYEPKWLYYRFCKIPWKKYNEATGVPSLSASTIKNIKIEIPTFDEQKKIASILSTWDKAIELKEKLIEQKKEQKKGLMQKLLTGEVRLPGFKGKWEKVYLKDVVIGKGKYGINAPSVEKSSELPTYLRITDISDEGYVHTNGLQSVNHPNSNDYFLEKNDIVFARTGASTGRTYLYDNSDGKLVYAGFLIKFSIDTNKAVPKYIKFCTQTEEYHNWVGVMSMRSGQPGINAEEYGQLPINLPPIKEQLEISNILSYLEREILLLESEREMITNQKNGLMQLLLTGKVRVKV
ncbi:restriction endonuclease subunit S [Ureibacillus sp. FSL E2-3493]|uniref:restriction endonuclease subunit S n=1 Tax=Ureibacillus sp. FSL E2-3493 TaxID=2921367 RepID=UPI003119EBB9